MARTLKIEERGDFHAKRVTPALRLKGRWLEAAGFPPGKHVSINVVANGVIEVRLI